jgi:hypothetical protein
MGEKDAFSSSGAGKSGQLNHHHHHVLSIMIIIISAAVAQSKRRMEITQSSSMSLSLTG